MTSIHRWGRIIAPHTCDMSSMVHMLCIHHGIFFIFIFFFFFCEFQRDFYPGEIARALLLGQQSFSRPR